MALTLLHELGENGCQCIFDYFFSIEDNYCILCSLNLPDCLDCSDNSTCTSCNATDNFELSNSTCICKNSYYLHLESTCQQCFYSMPNCLICFNSTFCSTCSQGFTEEYIVVQQICRPCSLYLAGCLSCQTISVCTLCDTSSNFILNGFQCDCTPSYFLNSSTNNTCESCSIWSSYCEACTSSSCRTCTTNYSVNQTRCSPICMISECLSCLNTSICTTCDADRFFTNNGTACVCQNGYFQSVDGQCELFQSILSQCKNGFGSLFCTECLQGFTLNLQTLECDAVSESILKMSLILAALFVAILN